MAHKPYPKLWWHTRGGFHFIGVWSLTADGFLVLNEVSTYDMSTVTATYTDGREIEHLGTFSSREDTLTAYYAVSYAIRAAVAQSKA